MLTNVSIFNMNQTREICEVEDNSGVCIIRLNRPEKHNALNHALASSLIRELQKAATNDSIFSIIIMGSGPSFCSGDDLSWHRSDYVEICDRPAMDPATHNPLYLKACIEITTMPKPVIAAARGAVLGAGLEIFCAADLRLCDNSAYMGNPLLKLGQAGGLVMLGRLVGTALAEDLFFTGRRLNSEEALQAGLISSVTTPEELTDRANQFAYKLGRRANAIAQFKLLREAHTVPSIKTLLELQGQAHLRLMSDSAQPTVTIQGNW